MMSTKVHYEVVGYHLSYWYDGLYPGYLEEPELKEVLKKIRLEVELIEVGVHLEVRVILNYQDYESGR